VQQGNRTFAYTSHIAIDKAQTIQEHDESQDEIKIYSDGSVHGGGVGAAVILYRQGKELWSLTYHLGSDKHHTVYEAEIVRLTLAVQLLIHERSMTSPISIFIDNKAAILSGANPSSSAGSYLIGKFIRLTHALKEKYTDQELNLQLLVRWIPGHAGVPGNEKADEEAKRAAESPNNFSA